MTKTELAKYMKGLEKYGMVVLNFQNKRRNPSGSKGMTDLMVLGKRKGEIWLLEIKTKTDKLSKIQTELGSILDGVANYEVLTEENYLQLFDEILKKFLTPLN